MDAHDDGLQAEFGTFARWTHDALRGLDADAAIPAGCRGSGRPSGLDWLLQRMAVPTGTALLDLGAGVGGPAAYARSRVGVQPVCVDPMPEAVAAAADVFGLPAIVGDGAELPFAPSSFAAGWSLGTLCTTDEKLPWLSELHRVMVPGAPLGLLVVTSTGESFHVPWGNAFPSGEELSSLLAAAGFTICDEAWSDELPEAGAEWQAAEERVDRSVRAAHRDDPRLDRIEQQEARMGGLIDSGRVRGRLIVARAASPGA